MSNLNHRARGLIGFARAEATDATAVFAELKRTVEAFKAEHTAELAGIKAKFADVVQTEKVDRINAEITLLSADLAKINSAIDSLGRAGNPGGSGGTPEAAAHATAFNTWFRRGTGENELRGLEVKAALRSNSDPDGGYLAPVQMETSIGELLRTVSTIRSLATVLTISAPVYKKLINRQGASAGWVGETGTRTETNTPTLSALEFPAMEIYANPASTQTALDDATMSLESWLSGEVAGEFADMEGAAFATGNGVAQPRGIFSYTNIANASYAWGKIGYIASGAAGAFATSNPADKVIDLVHALRSGYRQAARFLMNDLTLAAIRKIKDGTGDYIWRPGLEAGSPSTLLGYPVETDDNVADIEANSYSIAFGDFARGYLIVDRAGIRVLRDPFTNKPYVHFYTTKRVGGGVQNFEAIKLMKFAAS
tara:strand:+ start:656 stop:1930 length:1275 start_codon:yes stop_codon:yes gene_type:complete